MERGVGFQAKKGEKYISNIISETAHNYFFMVDFEKLGGSLM